MYGKIKAVNGMFLVSLMKGRGEVKHALVKTKAEAMAWIGKEIRK